MTQLYKDTFNTLEYSNVINAARNTQNTGGHSINIKYFWDKTVTKNPHMNVSKV